jgi:hypothetical protein
MVKECNLCHREINTKKERYVCVQDWAMGKKIKQLWMHLVCFNQAMNKELTDVQKQAQEMLARCGGIMDRFYGKEVKAYEVGV